MRRLHVKNMSVEDSEFAAQIIDEMNWNMVKEDFEFMLGLEPEGCFVLLDRSERIGIVTNVSFGQIGWLGNLIVSERSRNAGGGSLLVQRSVDYFKSKRVMTVGLYAYLDKVPFYERFGFVYDSEYVVLKGKGFSSSTCASVKEAGKGDFSEVLKYDDFCFGASRRKLLEPILQDPDNICLVALEKGQIKGYAVSKVYRKEAELGPLICSPQHDDIAICLLGATLSRLVGLEVSLCLPNKESMIISFLRKSGFSETLHVARMFLGPTPAEPCICFAESLERG